MVKFFQRKSKKTQETTRKIKNNRKKNKEREEGKRQGRPNFAHAVNLETKNSTIILSIDDDGPGVDKSEFNNITKPFYKIDKSRSESKSSVGLGLSISSDIITVSYTHLTLPTNREE